MQNKEQLDQFANVYLKLQKYRNVSRPPVILSFSGIPGSDKTALAKKLARDLYSQWIQHDGIRHTIAIAGYDPQKFSMVAISRIVIERMIKEDANKFVVLDLSIDRTWERFFEYNTMLNTQPIVIRLNVPVDILQKRLSEREGVSYFNIDRFEEFVMDFETCKKHVVADFELEIGYDYDVLLSGIKKLVGIQDPK